MSKKKVQTRTKKNKWVNFENRFQISFYNVLPSVKKEIKKKEKKLGC